MQTPRGHSWGSPPKSTPQRLGVSSLGFPQGIPRGGGGRRVPKGLPRVPLDVPWGTPWGISGAPQADPWGTPWGMHWVSPCPLYPPKGSTSVWGGSCQRLPWVLGKQHLTGREMTSFPHMDQKRRQGLRINKNQWGVKLTSGGQRRSPYYCHAETQPPRCPCVHRPSWPPKPTYLQVVRNLPRRD